MKPLYPRHSPGSPTHSQQRRIALQTRIVSLVSLYPSQLTLQSLFHLLRDLVPVNTIQTVTEDLQRARIIACDPNTLGFVLTQSYLDAQETLPRKAFSPWRPLEKKRLHKRSDAGKPSTHPDAVRANLLLARKK